MSALQPSSLATQQLHPLLARWQQGDRQAADELIRRVGLRLEALASRMLRRYPVVRTQAQTSDVMQEASLRLLKALREVTPESMLHFFNLASKHIRFQLLDLARCCRRGVPHPLSEQDEPVARGTERGELEELDRWTAMHEVVERLPDDQREVFGLRFYQGGTWAEIAELLRVNEKTGRRRWDLACIALSEELGDWIPLAEEASAGPES
jgi:RNA polymerase sigma factor (sigma-70 family)